MSGAVPLPSLELLDCNEKQLYKDEFSLMNFGNSFYLQFDMCNKHT